MLMRNPMAHFHSSILGSLMIYSILLVSKIVSRLSLQNIYNLKKLINIRNALFGLLSILTII